MTDVQVEPSQVAADVEWVIRQRFPDISADSAAALHHVAAVVYARGYDEGQRVEVIRNTGEERRAERSQNEELRAAQECAWEAGWHEHHEEHVRQLQNPDHPITANNPHRRTP